MADLEQAVLETIGAQMGPALGIESSKDKLDLQTVQQAKHEDKLRSIQDSKRQLYEQYVLGEIDLETCQERKAVYDAEQVLIDRLISKVYIFPGDRIEIEYVTQDFLGTEKPGKEA